MIVIIYCKALSYELYKQIGRFYIINRWIVFLLQELMSQMDEHNSTHTFLSAQMKNLNVSWLRSLSCTFQAELCTVLYLVKNNVSQFVEISQLRYFFLQMLLLRPVSLFYISLQSSSDFFYLLSCEFNFKLLKNIYISLFHRMTFDVLTEI